jgi:hypothetical protein
MRSHSEALAEILQIFRFRQVLIDFLVKTRHKTVGGFDAKQHVAGG